MLANMNSLGDEARVKGISDYLTLVPGVKNHKILIKKTPEGLSCSYCNSLVKWKFVPQKVMKFDRLDAL